MLQDAKDLQNEAVSSLVNTLKLSNKEITFKAPTGSGKTYMMADFMNRILSEHKNAIFLVSSLSKGDLAGQNYEKFKEYSDKKFFSNLNPYLINSEIANEERLFIPNIYNVYVLPRDLYKTKSLIKEQGVLNNFLVEMQLTGKHIILIKDECHIATKNLDELNSSFDKIINFSATPKLSRSQNPDVEIKNEDAENAKLIKKIAWGKCKWNGDDEDDSLADAITKFNEIKEQYINSLGVNPCLIIQISNETKADEEWNNIIKPELDKYPELKWMKIFGNDKDCDTNDIVGAKKIPVSKWKDLAKRNSGLIDIVIFKMVITEGWDIPRACMLYQLRNSKSKQLDEQVKGRVRRNPRLLDFEELNDDAQKLAMTAWVWGIKSEDDKKVIPVRLWDDVEDITNNIKIKTTRIKNLEEKIDFNINEYINNKKESLVNQNIFDLGRKLKSVTNETRNIIYKYATDYQKWWKASECADEIESESNRYKCDYSKSMEVEEAEVSFPTTTYYTDNGNHVYIGNWVWKRKNDTNKFSFDSEAEQEWANVLMNISNEIEMITVGKTKKNKNAGNYDLWGNVAEDIKLEEKDIFLWGKNFIANSNIKFEYYINKSHISYPDFVMKDKNGRIHIFEVKSANNSSSLNIDNEEYTNKVFELEKCYKHVSKITEQIFYIPVQKEDTWEIRQFINGNKNILSKSQFENFVKTMQYNI